jgi:hypothetical protein
MIGTWGLGFECAVVVAALFALWGSYLWRARQVRNRLVRGSGSWAERLLGPEFAGWTVQVHPDACRILGGRSTSRSEGNAVCLAVIAFDAELVGVRVVKAVGRAETRAVRCGEAELAVVRYSRGGFGLCADRSGTGTPKDRSLLVVHPWVPGIANELERLGWTVKHAPPQRAQGASRPT